MRTDLLRSVLIVLIAAFAAGCDRGIQITAGPRVEVLTGSLAGDSGGSVGCAWIEDVNGQRVEVFWPDGWSVEFDPVRLFDDRHDLIATAGDEVTVTGYYNQVGGSLCAVGRAFSARSVTASSKPSSASP